MTDYTDRDLLNQIQAESVTALEIGRDLMGAPAVALLEGFVRKIEAQLEGRNWWEPSGPERSSGGPPK
jgi:hypothetical protein